MKNTMITMLLLCISVTSVRAELIREEVEYKAGDTVLKGNIVKNSGCTGKVGAVLVVPEWWGLNAYARRRADMLADLGYVAMAVDMYGDGKLADRPDEASRLSTAIRKNRELEKERFLAALNVLREQPCVDPSKIAAIGYCFGGGVVLEMAREGVDLKGVASFHGRLTTEKPAEPGKVKAKILVLNGAEDQLTTPQDIAAFRQEMDQAGVSYRFINYPGAKHSFTNPDADTLGKEFNLPIAYNQAADQESWQELLRFLHDIGM